MDLNRNANNNKFRMVWWREVKWLFAAYLLSVVLRLIEREATTETLVAFYRLGSQLRNDPKYDTVRLRIR